MHPPPQHPQHAFLPATIYYLLYSPPSCQPRFQVALVGPSGGGKSTLVALMERFYDPSRGSVYLDAVPLPLIDHTFLHQQVPSNPC